MGLQNQEEALHEAFKGNWNRSSIYGEIQAHQEVINRAYHMLELVKRELGEAFANRVQWKLRRDHAIKLKWPVGRNFQTLMRIDVLEDGYVDFVYKPHIAADGQLKTIRVDPKNPKEFKAGFERWINTTKKIEQEAYRR